MPPGTEHTERIHASMKYQEQLEAYIDGKERELIAAVGRLVAVPSTKGAPEPGAPFGPGPRAALDEALKLAEEWGLTAASYDNYVGTIDLNEKETNLHILCHLDVVDPGTGWETNPYELTERDGLIYGRGVDDDKGPAAISLLAMRAVKDLGIPLKNNVRLILGTDEESGSGDIEYYFAREPFAEYTFSPDAEFPVINLEKGGYHPLISRNWAPETALPRVTAIRGGIRINVVSPEAGATVLGLTAAEVRPAAQSAEASTGTRIELADSADGLHILVHGKNAHASTPDEGINANTALLELLSALPLAKTDSTEAICALHALFPHGDNRGTALGIAMEDEISHELTLTLSLLEMTETGIRAQFDSRTPLCASKENCIDICEAACAAHGLQCAGDLRPVHYTPAETPFIQTLLQCYENYSGKKGCCVAIGGGTYVHDIPGGVAFGAGSFDFDSRLHAANERARISSMLMAAKIYAQSIVELCGA